MNAEVESLMIVGWHIERVGNVLLGVVDGHPLAAVRTALIACSI